jgi:multiple sugar transport system permease protein
MAVAIPIYIILRRLGLLDTKLALILVHSAFTLPFTIWVLTLYFSSLPRELEEAALIDGCTRFGALRHIVLPLAAPGLAAIGAFSFLFSYNEFFLHSSPRRQSTRKPSR